MEKIMGFINAGDFGASGSSFETIGKITAGSCIVEVEDAGDFQVGQQIRMFGANPRCDSFRIFGPKPFHARQRPIADEVQLRGWDASNGDHVVYFLDIDREDPTSFRWTDDQGRSWHAGETLDREWHQLSGGLEVRFCEYDWTPGYAITIVMRASMDVQILKIEGNLLTIDQSPKRSCTDLIMHSDTKALQNAIDVALAEGADLWIPEGIYRLSDSLVINNAKSFTIRGSSPERTILDIGKGGIGIEAEGGSCLVLKGGEEVNVLNLGFQGGIGFAQRDQAGLCEEIKGATGVWGFYFMKCNAMSIWSTRRVYVENCHARKMSAECFYSSSISREADLEPEQYTTSITYVRCSVEDCARNAFNNNDHAENTHIIDCRIRDVGGCTWEGASRYVQMRGCYVRNSGNVGMGNVRSRKEQLERLGTGQHIIVDNTFESGCSYGDCQIRAGACASQVIIKGNNFINFNSNAIIAEGNTGPYDLPSRNVIITGNTFDMTAEGVRSVPRTAIGIRTMDVTVSDNQIFTTIPDENVTAIELQDNAQGIIIHDNLIRGCGEFIRNTTMLGAVGEILDERRFKRKNYNPWQGAPAMPRRRSHRYRGWIVCWENGEESVMEEFDPETCIFTLKEARNIKEGDCFTMKPRYADGRIMDERLIHDNLFL